MEEELNKLTNRVLKGLDKDFPIKSETISYIKDMLIAALNHGHGNLIAVVDDIDLIKSEGHLQNGFFLSEAIDFTKLLFDNYKLKSDQTATTLNVFTQLVVSMLNFDGITLFNSTGCVVGYHFIVDNNVAKGKAIVGGARTKAFEALKQTNGILACLMKSQDGIIKYFEKNE